MPHRPNDETISRARKNWQRAVSVAIQAGVDDNRAAGTVTTTENDSSRHSDVVCQTQPKLMDLQYFLEMVDAKHRHGSNLRAYHTVWKSSPSSENFFYWLDQGAGRSVDLPQCPRERLEKEQVRYLSPKERFNYLVSVDEEGLFRWAKNNELVDTDDRRYKDSIYGVVRVDDNAPRFSGYSQRKTTERENESVPAGSIPSPQVDEDDDDEGFELSTPEDFEIGSETKSHTHATPAAMYDRVATSFSINTGTWLFVGAQISCQVCAQLTVLNTGGRFVVSHLCWYQGTWRVPAFFVPWWRSNICGRYAQDPARSAAESVPIEVSFENTVLAYCSVDF